MGRTGRSGNAGRRRLSLVLARRKRTNHRSSTGQTRPTIVTRDSSYPKRRIFVGADVSVRPKERLFAFYGGHGGPPLHYDTPSKKGGFFLRRAAHKMGTGLKTFFRRFDSRILEAAKGVTLGSNLFFPPLPPHADVKSTAQLKKKMQELAQRLRAVLTSIQVLRAHYIVTNYPASILLNMAKELRALDESFKERPESTPEVSPKYLMNLPDSERPLGPSDYDSVSQYTSELEFFQIDFMTHFVEAVMRSSLILKRGFSEESFETDPHFLNLARHAQRVTNDGVPRLMKDYLNLFPEIKDEIPRLIPEDLEVPEPAERTDSDLIELFKTAYRNRPRVWDYSPSQEMAAGTLPEVRELNEYYGYAQIQRRMGRLFSEFARGHEGTALLLKGPPGVGKTELPIAYIEQLTNLEMIRVAPSHLDKLEGIINEYGARFGRYVIIIDDVGMSADVESQWKPFRNVYAGAKGAAPKNVILIISSNGEFPENVRSRGQYFEFPDLSDPRQSSETVDGIIRAHVESGWKTNGEPEFINNVVKFIIHDYLVGAELREGEPDDKGRRKVYEHITKSVGRPKPHKYELSPRGLLKYLEDLAPTGRWNEIRKRMNRFDEEEAKRLRADVSLKEMARPEKPVSDTEQPSDLEAELKDLGVEFEIEPVGEDGED